MFRPLFAWNLLHLICCCQALKDVKVSVPLAVVRGEKAILHCTYDLEGEALYSLKWYRGEREFFRYTPNERPHIKLFEINGLNVSVDESNDKQVVLQAFFKNISGPFSCEITADQPSFFTDMQTASLEVVDLPKADPLIIGLKQRYKVGDNLRAECISEDSSPAANLTWFVNDHSVEPMNVHKHRVNRLGDAVTAKSVLRLQTTKQHFSKGRLKIRCVASIHDVYLRSSEKSVELEKKRHRQHNNFFHHTTHPTPTTTEPPLAPWQWEDYQPAERYPDTTLVFSPMNSMASIFNAGIVVTNSVFLSITLTSISLLR